MTDKPMTDKETLPESSDSSAEDAPKTYLDSTYNSGNPLRRHAHRTRMKLSLGSIELSDGMKLLDFGCGDALFLNKLLSSSADKKLRLLGFEPYMETIAGSEVEVVREWDEVEQHVAEFGKFDYLTCFEVLEHFSEPRQREALSRMASVLKPSGKLILSVPIEQGIPSLAKNLIRRVNHPHAKERLSLGNLFRSVFRIPIPEHRSGDAYLHHMGFYFSDLEKVLAEKYQILQKRCSPFLLLGSYCNSQVFYELQPKS